MKPIENVYEGALLHALAPVAQKGAMEVFATWTLEQMLESWFNNNVPTDFLKRAGIPPRFWEDMLRAALVAKLTYMRPDNPRLNKEQRLWLVTAAAFFIDMPLGRFTLTEIAQGTRLKYPVFSEWVIKMATHPNAKAA